MPRAIQREVEAVKAALRSLEDTLVAQRFTTLEAAAETWDELDQMRGRVADSAASVKATLARFRGKPENLVLQNGSTLAFGYGKPRKAWDHARLAGVVAEKVLEAHVDRETGVIEAPTTVLMGKMLKYGHVDYWRVKALREDLGIEADNYCEAGRAEFSVRAVRSDMKGKP